ncbi:glycosyltransferase [Chryseolinea lacunae]|uniref:Glycosyltransferase n=1 Tax=Chryseolinea lacunae TaxID=2801331 RepID=A0ABS1KX42_9BACT|nr:glycosyltransferase [Chryseolinea lacunae]MBL0744030.1 glycosyltransferase [Chryseolinea lacunae]
MASDLKVLHVNTLDQGGAANACIRLHKSLLDLHVDSKLLVRKKTKNIPQSFLFRPSSRWDKAMLRARKVLHELKLVDDPTRNRQERAQQQFKKKLPPGSEYFSFPESAADITSSAVYRESDIIHLHWVADFLDYPSFFRLNKKPVIWTLHDMGPFQGGIHYEEKFQGMTDAGGQKENEMLGSLRQTLEHNLAIKIKALSDVKDLHIVAPSRWLTECSKGSALFKRFPHSTIPYGLDTTIFAPRDKRYSRELLGMPVDKTCLLFVADNLQNHRKGFAFLQRALTELNANDVELCAIGLKKGDIPNSNVRFLGRIEDERMMSVAYSAADAFIIPSVEDNLPNTVLESLLCGTPVIGFPVGGVVDMVEHGHNGLLCDRITADALKDTIFKFLKNTRMFDSADIRRKASEKYNLRVQANAYLGLYTQIKSVVNKG